MKKLSKNVLAVFIALTLVIGTYSCTKHDQVIDPNVAPAPALNTDTLFSFNGTATLQPQGGGVWDGNIEAIWNTCDKLKVTATVPDMGNEVFEGFKGKSTDITMRSLYDAN